MAEYCRPSFFLSRMVEDMWPARIKKATAEFLKSIGGILTSLGTFWNVGMIDSFQFE